MKEIRDYHECAKVSLGYSDIARLTLVGPDGATTLDYGMDESYSAYLVDRRDPEEVDIIIPDHYQLRASFEDWLWVFDDEEKMYRVDAPHHTINVYRAGEMGTLIEISK